MAKATTSKATKPNTTKNGSAKKNGNGKKRPWTDADKERAIAVYVTTGNLSRTSRETGVPISTLRGWLAEQPPEKVAQARLDAKKQFIQAAWETVLNGIHVGNTLMSFALENKGRIDAAIDAILNSDFNKEDKVELIKAVSRLSKFDLREVSTYIGTIYDKIALATGQPTSIAEQQGQVTQRYEYDVTQRIISDPEAVQLAEQLLRRAAYSDAGASGLDCQ